MSDIEVIAIFSVAEEAHAALEQLDDLNERGIRASITAQCGIRATVSRQTQAKVTEMLRKLGALDVIARDKPPESDWMSHQNGRVTGTGVEPGAGDMEAGLPNNWRT
jgi:hypothetical protein